MLELLAQGSFVDAGHGEGLRLFGLDRHHRGEDGEALRRRHRLVALAPTFCLALDALGIREVLAGEAWPVYPVRGEVEPELLGTNTGLVHYLKLQGAPAGKLFVIQARGVAGKHHRAGQALELLQQFEMILLFVVEAIAAIGGAGAVKVGRITIDQLPARIRMVSKKAMGAAVDLLHRIVALEGVQRLAVEIDADVA